MTAGAEADKLIRVFWVGLGLVESGFELSDVDQEIFWCGLTGEGMNTHWIKGDVPRMFSLGLLLLLTKCLSIAQYAYSLLRVRS